MSKTKTPFPEDPVAGFAITVSILARQMGIDKVKEIQHFVELLMNACDRYQFESEHNIDPNRKLENDKRSFLVIFKSRYVQFTDIEYDFNLTGVDFRMILQICKKLQERGFSVDEYLQWFYEIFLDENPRYCPPNVKQACSAFVWQKFIYDNKDKVKERAQQEFEKQQKEQALKEGMELVARARVLMRKADDANKPDFKENVKNILRIFRNEGIIAKLRNSIEVLEAEVNQWVKEA